MKLPDGFTMTKTGVTDDAVTYRVTATPVIHRSPEGDSGQTPCCGRPPFELPRWHRITNDAEPVTCQVLDRLAADDAARAAGGAA